MKKIGLIFGGPGNEHDISIKSAKNIVKNFPYQKYKLTLIYWNKKSSFQLIENIEKINKDCPKINLEELKNKFDIALPITHGRYGEDGVLQGLLESQKIKYCGCKTLSSALCMDKGVFKQFLENQNVNQVKFAVLDYNLESKEEINEKISKIKAKFKLPIFIKPANSGSSVGITKLESFTKINQAIKDASKHDKKIIIEEGLSNPREIEVAVLGNKELIISQPGELKPAKDFYDFDDKYKLGQAKSIIPAPITTKQNKEIGLLAEKIYKACGCSGFARIDFFIANNKIYLNEINTLPGFTDISMYPMLMMEKGISYQKLIEKIINLAY